MKEKLKRFDRYFIELINNRIKTRHLDSFMYRVTNLGGVFFTSLTVLIIIFFGSNKNKYLGFEVLISITICQIVVYTLKAILSRERPYNILEHLHTFGIEMKDYSFPSGHSAASFSIATIVALNIPRLSIYVFALAMIIGVSRIYLGVHYPTDVAAGVILGFSISLMVHLYLLDYIKVLVELIKS